MSQSSEAGSSNSGGDQPSGASLLAAVEKSQTKTGLPNFRVGDTVKVHAKIREGAKERVQVFEGVVIRRNKGNHATATFTVRKVSFNIGVERVFLLHSPVIEKIEVVSTGEVRRGRLYYLRNLRGRSARIKSQLVGAEETKIATAKVATETEKTDSTDEKKQNGAAKAGSETQAEAGQA